MRDDPSLTQILPVPDRPIPLTITIYTHAIELLEAVPLRHPLWRLAATPDTHVRAVMLVLGLLAPDPALRPEGGDVQAASFTRSFRAESGDGIDDLRGLVGALAFEIFGERAGGEDQEGGEEGSWGFHRCCYCLVICSLMIGPTHVCDDFLAFSQEVHLAVQHPIYKS